MDEVAVMAAVMEEVVIGLINHFSMPKSTLHFTLITLFIVCAFSKNFGLYLFITFRLSLSRAWPIRCDILIVSKQD